MKRLILFFACLLIGFLSHAQTIFLNSNYMSWDNYGIFNPAATAQAFTTDARLFANYDFNNNSSGVSLNAEQQFSGRNSFGVFYRYSEIMHNNTQRMNLRYARSFSVNKNMKFSLGASVNFDRRKLIYSSQGESITNHPSFTAGFLLRSKKINFGGGATYYAKEQSLEEYMIYHGRIDIDLLKYKNVLFTPSVSYYFYDIERQPTTEFYDFGLKATYQDNGWLRVSYDKHRLINVFMGYTLLEKYQINYGFSYYYSHSLNIPMRGGLHSISVAYKIKNDTEN